MSESPLCPQLYQALQTVFGEVLISSPGEELVLGSRQGLLATLQAQGLQDPYLRHQATFGSKGIFHQGRRMEVLESGEYYRVRCLTGETMVATQAGDVPIRDLVGTAVLLVPNHKGLGHWQKHQVRSFGRQPLLSITLRRKGIQKVIRATPDHRWLISGRIGLYAQRTSAQLAPGDRLPSCFGRTLASYGRLAPQISAAGVCQGFVFGDGSRESQGRAPAMVSIYSRRKLQGLRLFFRGYRMLPGSDKSGRCCTVVDLPRSWKDLPSAEESFSFLLGWLAGYFAADGHVGRNGKQAVLSSARPENLQFAKGICYQLGIRVSPIRLCKRGSGGCVPQGVDLPMYGMAISVRDLPESFWLLPHHRERALAWIQKAQPEVRCHWVVVGVQDLGEEDEVFCATVPGIERFTLADNLLTMNCPYCGDDRFRLWINHRWAEFPALAICYRRNCLADEDNRYHLRLNVLQIQMPCKLHVHKGQRLETERLGPIQPPGQITPIDTMPYTHRSVRYLESRGYDIEELASRYGVGYCHAVEDPRHSALAGRIYVPIFLYGRLVGWQGRYLPPEGAFDAPHPKGVAKYTTTPRLPKRMLVYQYDSSTQGRVGVVCEGVTDVWRFGPEAVALLGHDVSLPQAVLLSHWVKKDGALLFLLDGNVTPKGPNVDSLYRTYGKRLGVIRLPEHLDPGQATQTALRHNARRLLERMDLDPELLPLEPPDVVYTP